MRKMVRLRKLLPAVAALTVISAGISFAAIPSSDGTISACRDSRGRLTVIDAEAGQTCRDEQQLLTWNQEGPAGSAKAYAYVDHNGDVVEQSSKGIGDANVTKSTDGVYCIDGLEFQPTHAVVSLGTHTSLGTGLPTPLISIPATGCVTGTDIGVSMFVSDSERRDWSFWILVN